MTTLDRQLFVGYLRSYAIVLVSLLSLFIVLDLFINLDDFTKGSLANSLRHIFNYYTAHVSKIFNTLSEAITLNAAMFTVAWMQRSNELLPQLSAGVSTRRVIRPLVLGCFLTLCLGPLNQEIVIPVVSDELQKPRDDPDQGKPVEVRGAFDGTGVHLEGYAGLRREKKVKAMFVTFPATGAGGMSLFADEAVYVPPGPGPRTGGWKLYNTDPVDIDGPLPAFLERDSTGIFFLHTRDIDFDSVTRSGNWYLYSSTPKLIELLAKPDARRQPAVAVDFHRRLVRPLIGMIMVLMGLGIILRDQNKHVFLNAGLCLILSAVFYAVVYGCKFLGENDYIGPPLAAWLPVMVFGPVAIALFDSVHT